MMDDMIDYGYAATSASILSEYPTATLHESSIPWNYCHIFWMQQLLFFKGMWSYRNYNSAFTTCFML